MANKWRGIAPLPKRERGLLPSLTKENDMDELDKIQKAIAALAKYSEFMMAISNASCKGFYAGMLHSCDKINDFIERNITNDKHNPA